MTKESQEKLDELKKFGKILFGADWCGPCKMLKARLSAEKMEYAFVDVDNEREISRELDIKGLPTCIVFNEDGEETDRKVGSHAITPLYFPNGVA